MQPKFKIGDVVQDSADRSYKFKVIKVAKKGEVISGKWYDSTKNKTMPVDSYIIEGYRSGLIFMLGFDHEHFYESVEEYDTKQKQHNSSVSKEYPDKCTHCGAPAYIGLSSIDCSKNCKGSQ